ncbi:nucleotidyltransferase domain-containing protein [Cryptosporangium sp. NPDC048952]|uniref:nucleotidyltransferase domain-containing protein n=1 Tax=Cryptosporangium sp. NPDC048952 TaxID=3363961 RepID=UPI003722D0A1
MSVLGALAAAGCRAWVSGGWGVDALVGRQSRPHRDLDLALDASHEREALDALAQLGYGVETDWRPVRVELARAGCSWVDLHPVVFGEAGHGRQAGLGGALFSYPRDCFVTGRIAGVQVGCYEPRDVDRADEGPVERSRPGARDALRAGGQCGSAAGVVVVAAAHVVQPPEESLCVPAVPLGSRETGADSFSLATAATLASGHSLMPRRAAEVVRDGRRACGVEKSAPSLVTRSRNSPRRPSIPQAPSATH